MPCSETIRKQVALLIRALPLVAEEPCFAFKGGTAINLFVRDMPRLSVYIDLTDEAIMIAKPRTRAQEPIPPWSKSNREI